MRTTAKFAPQQVKVDAGKLELPIKSVAKISVVVEYIMEKPTPMGIQGD